jgi:hypothetical protein
VNPDARHAGRIGQVVEVAQYSLGAQRLPVRATEDESLVVERRSVQGFGTMTSGSAA